MRGYSQNKTIYILYGSLWGPYKARVQNGVSGSYMDAVFELVAHEESEIWTSLSHSFTTTALRLVESLYKDMSAINEQNWRTLTSRP